MTNTSKVYRRIKSYLRLIFFLLLIQICIATGIVIWLSTSDIFANIILTLQLTVLCFILIVYAYWSFELLKEEYSND